jgi:hypothetical protein
LGEDNGDNNFPLIGEKTGACFVGGINISINLYLSFFHLFLVASLLLLRHSDSFFLGVNNDDTRVKYTKQKSWNALQNKNYEVPFLSATLQRKNML